MESWGLEMCFDKTISTLIECSTNLEMQRNQREYKTLEVLHQVIEGLCVRSGSHKQ